LNRHGIFRPRHSTQHHYLSAGAYCIWGKTRLEYPRRFCEFKVESIRFRVNLSGYAPKLCGTKGNMNSKLKQNIGWMILFVRLAVGFRLVEEWNTTNRVESAPPEK
jgi:hypothetical protein